ncbi:MAG: collagen-like protein [Xenococcaceae cyanobacterium]
MQMRFLGKLFLFLVFLTLPNFLAFDSESALCSLLALDTEVKDFGRDGQDGSEGKNGRGGRDKESQTIFTDGSPMTLDLSGEDGLRGEDGGNGGSALCGKQPQDVNYNLRAPNGGNGGNGGDGGNGGNGGSLTIYATNRAYLRQISVLAAGGKGGQPGNGGNGGKGCKCPKPYWNLETCTGRPGSSNYSCTTREFSCQDGDDGRNGGVGRNGRDGRPGSLTLINRNQPLTPDRLIASVAMSELKDRGFILSRNKWETRSGAASLLAPGSVIADQYLELVERLERSFLLTWNAPQPFSNFADKIVTLSLKDDQGIEISLPEDVWVETKTLQQSEVTQFLVYNAILKSEATKLKSTSLSGNGSNLTLNLVDLARRSDLILTEFRIRYRTTRSDPRFRPVSDYRTKYEGNMPAELVSLNDNRFTLNIGQLPIEPESFRPGLGVEIELVATRSFAGHSTEQKIIVRDVIGSFR